MWQFFEKLSKGSRQDVSAVRPPGNLPTTGGDTVEMAAIRGETQRLPPLELRDLVQHGSSEWEDLSPLMKAAGIPKRQYGENTDFGIHLVTPAKVLFEGLCGTRVTVSKPLTFLDAGSGQGETLLRFLGMIPNSTAIGIEGDSVIFEESTRLVREAVRQRPDRISSDRVTLVNGDFNRGHDPLFDAADLIYYYSLGSNDPAALAHTIARSAKPGCRILEAGLKSQLSSHLVGHEKFEARQLFCREESVKPYVRVFFVEQKKPLNGTASS